MVDSIEKKLLDCIREVYVMNKEEENYARRKIKRLVQNLITDFDNVRAVK